MAKIKTVEQLRDHYHPAGERALAKQLTRLEQHSRRYIELSPYLAVSSVGSDDLVDVSPRGEMPGFVHVVDDVTLLIPDRPGNNRLDTLQNLITNPAIGLLFMIPGINEVLRVNGTAEVRNDPELLEKLTVNNRAPIMVMVVTVVEAYLHCAKAIVRARLWDDAAKNDRSVLPSMGEMVRDQTDSNASFETQTEMEERHKTQLY